MIKDCQQLLGDGFKPGDFKNLGANVCVNTQQIKMIIRQNTLGCFIGLPAFKIKAKFTIGLAGLIISMCMSANSRCHPDQDVLLAHSRL